MSFIPHQIVCLEYQNTCLHGEVVQIIESRQLCWFRPLFMVINHWNNHGDILVQEEVIDLRSSSDLLWPTSLFRSSLDTEYLAFFSLQNKTEQYANTKSTFNQYFNQFINRVWQANKDKF